MSLVLGPLLRHVDADSATVWVETASAAAVEVRAGGASGHARTFAVHGHHYALVEVTGLEPGSATAYTVEVGGEQVWPETGSSYPPPRIHTLQPGRPLRLAYGSCRVSAPHDEASHDRFGVDALRTYGLHLADEHEVVPDLLLLLGDQVYADETSEAMRAFISSRRDADQPPGWELRDYEEYAEIYRLAWSDPATRWLLSTVPSAMIFDDHDIRDDWNISASWRRDMWATDWWRDRIVGGLGAYWVHQHLGNLDAASRAQDPLWRQVADHEDPDELDLSAALDELVERADKQPTTFRWSFARQLDDQARLVVVDSRAARVFEEQRRSMVDDEEMDWLDRQLRGDVDHLLIGTSLPYLLSPGLHHVEAAVEVVNGGLLGRHGRRAGEWLRRALDIEHWAAFQEGFAQVGSMVREVAAGRRGRAPVTITFLSGDVHHSYLVEAEPAPGGPDLEGPGTASRILQAVCSPMRNPLPRAVRAGVRVAARGRARPTGRMLGRRVPPSPLHWRMTHGPWFENLLATLEASPDGLRLTWSTGVVVDDDHQRPRWQQVARVDV